TGGGGRAAAAPGAGTVAGAGAGGGAATAAGAWASAGAGTPGLGRPAAARPPPDAAGGPWVIADGERVALRQACARLPDWPVGAVRAFGAAEVDDLFALDLAAVGDTAAARRGSLGRAGVAASLQRLGAGAHPARPPARPPRPPAPRRPPRP